jgi:hypothetical protein
MQHRKLSTTLAMFAATAGVTVFAASAQAGVVVDNDGASLTGHSEVTLTDANLAFNFDSSGILPKLTGTLEVVNGDDACFRARLASYDGSTLLHDKPGITRCLQTDQLREFSINLPEDRDPLTDKVVVSVEKDDGPQGSWRTKDERELDMNTFSDTFRIFGAGVDIGGDAFAAGDPTNNASVAWSIDDGNATATYDGWYHFDAFLRRGRVQLRMLDESGAQVEVIDGPEHFAPDLAHYAYQDVLASTPSPNVVEVEVAMQTKSGGVFSDVDTETVSIAEQP